MLVECGTNLKLWLTFIGIERIFRTVKSTRRYFVPQLDFIAFSKKVKQDVGFVLSFMYSYCKMLLCLCVCFSCYEITGRKNTKLTTIDLDFEVS